MRRSSPLRLGAAAVFAMLGTLSGCVASGEGWVCTPQMSEACACTDRSVGTRVCEGGSAWGSCNQGCVCNNGMLGITACDGSAQGCFCAGVAEICTAGQTQSCTCSGGTSGAQQCLANGVGYGTCACGSSMCSVMFGLPCTADAQCCALGSASTFCASFTGIGDACATRCTMDSMCSTGCCATLSDGTFRCGPASECSSSTACTRELGATCSTDADCCPDVGNGLSVVCLGYAGAAPTCWSTCTTNAECSTGCCVGPAGGTRACAPVPSCAVSTTCSVDVGAPCVTDTDCCVDTATGAHTLCSNFGEGPVCSDVCTMNSQCTTGCCAARTSDGMKSCAVATACG